MRALVKSGSSPGAGRAAPELSATVFHVKQRANAAAYQTVLRRFVQRSSSAQPSWALPCSALLCSALLCTHLVHVSALRHSALRGTPQNLSTNPRCQKTEVVGSESQGVSIGAARYGATGRHCAPLLRGVGHYATAVTQARGVCHAGHLCDGRWYSHPSWSMKTITNARFLMSNGNCFAYRRQSGVRSVCLRHARLVDEEHCGIP